MIDEQKDISFPYEIEYIEWVDSFGCGSSWQYIEHDYFKRSALAHKCISIGFVLYENNECIVIASHFSGKNEANGAEEQACGDMTIPKVAVIKRKVINRNINQL